MDIIATFAPPRICYLGGDPYWLRPFTAEDWAMLIAWLDDVIPGRAERKLAPDLGGEAARAAMASKHGLAVVLYAAMRHQGISYPRAAELAVAATDEEQIRISDVLFARRRYGPKGGGGDDLSSSWWGPDVVAMADRFRVAVDALGRLTFDQIDCYAGLGCEDENPAILTDAQLAEIDAQVDAMIAANAAGAAE